MHTLHRHLQYPGNQMQPYTYLIRWSQLNISYYGVRYAQDCDPSDLWNPYKTSSIHVEKFVAQYGNPDVIQVRKIFTDTMATRLWENRVLKRMKVVSSGRWLNKHDQMSPPINPLGNLRMKEPALRKKASDNNKGSGNPMFGKKQDRIVCKHCNKEVSVNTYSLWHGDRCETINPIHKETVSTARSGKNNALFGKKRTRISCLFCKTTIDVANFGRYHNDFCLKNPNSKPRKPRPMKECSHCRITIDVGNYAKLHGHKCKMNLTSLVANTDDIVYNKS